MAAAAAAPTQARSHRGSAMPRARNRAGGGEKPGSPRLVGALAPCMLIWLSAYVAHMEGVESGRTSGDKQAMRTLAGRRIV
jgi:hypothetical protein